MATTRVTVIRCVRCHQTGNLSREGEHFWCAFCKDWTGVDTEQLEEIAIERGAKSQQYVSVATEPNLQPLRIPGGWLVSYNDGLYEVDPIEAEGAERWMFKEDLLQLKRPTSGHLIDVGWFPDGNLKDGEYAVVVCFEDDYEQFIHEFRTRDRHVLVAEIERLMQGITLGEYCTRSPRRDP